MNAWNKGGNAWSKGGKGGKSWSGDGNSWGQGGAQLAVRQKWDKGAAQGSAPADEELVATIKDMQKSDPVGHQAWVAYVESQGGGRRDPSRHSDEFIQGFLQLYKSGGCAGWYAKPAASDGSGYAAVVKQMQRKSEPFKTCWALYCQQKGAPHDPCQHDPQYIMAFLDGMSKSCVGMGGCMRGRLRGSTGGGRGMDDMMYGGRMGCGGPLAKRMKTESSGDVVHDQYVDSIKAYQKTGQAEKEAWETYCDNFLNGMRDPAKHDRATLEEFIDSYGVPKTPLGGCRGGSSSHYVPGTDREKDALIARVKAFQRMGNEQKEAWHVFCGPTRDPARHTSENLQTFCDQYSVP